MIEFSTSYSLVPQKKCCTFVPTNEIKWNNYEKTLQVER
jgi:hypothetical protein